MTNQDLQTGFLAIRSQIFAPLYHMLQRWACIIIIIIIIIFFFFFTQEVLIQSQLKRYNSIQAPNKFSQKNSRKSSQTKYQIQGQYLSLEIHSS